MATRRIPGDEFTANLFHAYIHERIARLWPRDRLSITVGADMATDGTWPLTIGPRDIHPGGVFDADVQGAVWIEDDGGRPEVVWQVGDQSNHDGMLPPLPF